MIRASAVANVADLGNFSPGHGRHLCVQIDNELADLWGQRLARFSRSTLLAGGKKARHPRTFKLISFAGQGALGEIDFFGSLPCGLVEQDERANRFIQLLLRPQRPLLNTCPLLRPFSALAFRPRHLPLPFADTTVASSLHDPLSIGKDSRGMVARLGTHGLPV